MDIGGLISKAFNRLFGESSFTVGNKPNKVEAAMNKAQSQQTSNNSTVVKAAQQVSRPTDVETMKKAIRVYGGENSKLELFANQLSKATEKYPFLRDNPYIPVIQSHLETSSGKYITRPHNLTNWGINFPGNNEEFAKMTEEDVLDRYLSGISERSDIYKKFRTGKRLTDEEIMEYAKIYEPNNPAYPENMVKGLHWIEQNVR